QPCSDHLKNESAQTPVRVTALVRTALPRKLLHLRLIAFAVTRNGSNVLRGGTAGLSARTRDALNLRFGAMIPPKDAYYGSAFKNISPVNGTGSVKPSCRCTSRIAGFHS